MSTSHLCCERTQGRLNLTEKDRAWKCLLMCHKSTLGLHCFLCVSVCICMLRHYDCDSWAQVWQQQQRPVQQVCGCVCLNGTCRNKFSSPIVLMWSRMEECQDYNFPICKKVVLYIDIFCMSVCPSVPPRRGIPPLCLSLRSILSFPQSKA